MLRRLPLAAAAAAAALLLLGTVAPGHADPAADPAQTIEERRQFMKDLGDQLRVARNFVQEGQGSAADVVAAAQIIAERAERIPTLFPEGTGMHEVEIETGARPAIWEDPDDFAAKAADLREAALAFAAAAEGAERQAVGAAMGTFGQQGCGGCHRTYREDIN